MDVKPVNTKRDFVRRYEKGEFGNRAPTWDTYDEWYKSRYTGLTHIRNRIAGGPTWYNVPSEKMPQVYRNILTSGVATYDLYFSAMAPHEHTRLQGEVRESIGHLDLTYTKVKKPMREAFKDQQLYAKGLKAYNLLKANLCSNSYFWMEELLAKYPGHVIEFSAFSVDWGTLPNHNTVIWEVRNY